MAFGTIPVITPEVSIESYMEPVIENIHYIRVNNSDEFKQGYRDNANKYYPEELRKLNERI